MNHWIRLNENDARFFYTINRRKEKHDSILKGSFIKKMKRLERLGSIAFLTITICFVFHLIAMSFNVWIKNNCQNCDENNLWTNWNTALRSRCYQTSVGSISSSNKTGQSFLTEICLPNQFLSAKNSDSAEYCLLKAINQTHTICSLRNYDENRCECQ